MVFSGVAVAGIIGGGLVLVLVITAILRLTCYLVREDVPSWTAALGIKVGALLINVVFSGFLSTMASAAARRQQLKPDVVIALMLFTGLTNLLLNASVYKVTMPWLTFAKSLLVVFVEIVIGGLVAAVAAGSILLVVTSAGWYTTEELIENLKETPTAEQKVDVQKK